MFILEQKNDAYKVAGEAFRKERRNTARFETMS
jgi:hypothetical protein